MLDTISKLFAWAEDNHYLQNTALMIKKLETELAALKSPDMVLVRRDDLIGVIGLAKNHESYQKYGFESAAIDRLKAALEKKS